MNNSNVETLAFSVVFAGLAVGAVLMYAIEVLGF